MNKGNFDFSDFDSLSRSEMKMLMAGSGGTNWIVCVYGGVVCEQCATYDGSSPYYKCVQVCNGYPDNASWKTAQNCSEAGW